MATSGSVSTSKYTYASGVSMGLKCTWSVQSQSEEDGTTTLAWTLASDGASGYSFYTGNISLVIDGTTAYSHYAKIDMQGGGAWSTSGTMVIKHDNDGTKKFTISITAGVYAYTSSNCTGTGTFELDPIYIGAVYLDTGSGYEEYLLDIDNGTNWEQYIPEVDSGTAWIVCN